MTNSESNPKSTTRKVKDAETKAAAAVRETAHDTAGKVSAELSDAAERTRSGAAKEVQEIADALHTAAAELDDGSSQRRVIGVVADNLDHVSNALHDRSIGEMVGELNDLARRNPVVFLGGAALIGFAATRLLTASATDRQNSSSSSRGQSHTQSPTPVSGGSAASGGV